MNNDDPDEAKVDQFIVFAAYGSVMLEFQRLELTMMIFLSRNLKPKTTFEQAMMKVESWSKSTLGQIYNGVKNQGNLTKDLIDEMDGAIDARNFLAHQFLIEYAVVKPSEENKGRALNMLARVANRLEARHVALDSHLTSQGFEVDDPDQQIADQYQPTEWFG